LFRGFLLAAAHTLRQGDQHPLPLPENNENHTVRAWVAVG
jgi:hypothetical protein